jgi:hypothetical protein
MERNTKMHMCINCNFKTVKSEDDALCEDCFRAYGMKVEGNLSLNIPENSVNSPSLKMKNIADKIKIKIKIEKTVIEEFQVEELPFKYAILNWEGKIIAKTYDRAGAEILIKSGIYLDPKIVEII